MTRALARVCTGMLMMHKIARLEYVPVGESTCNQGEEVCVCVCVCLVCVCVCVAG